jgi:hypothetical protein
MLRPIVCSAFVILLLGQGQDKPGAATSQPTSQPAARTTPLRKPADAELLRKLLARKDQPAPIPPQHDKEPTKEEKGIGPDGQPLLLEGAAMVERPGRLVRDGGRPRFVFFLDGEAQAARTMPILESQLLETLENEADAGFREFIISGEVTRYRGENFILLRKVLRRTGQDNVAP